jgi:hypothetical protein
MHILVSGFTYSRQRAQSHQQVHRPLEHQGRRRASRSTCGRYRAQRTSLARYYALQSLSRAVARRAGGKQRQCLARNHAFARHRDYSGPLSWTVISTLMC